VGQAVSPASEFFRRLRYCYTGLLRHLPFPVALCAALAIGAWATPQASTTKKKTVTHSTAKTATTAKASTKSTVKRPVTAKSKKAVVVARRPLQPSPERLKEIQQALATRGYFTTEPDGTWGPASIDALKRFQHDQNLVEDGKIGSLSLIALGLGPKREPPVEADQKLP
jgi:peptidoglycan hydrolase-like protein with peptidoglycan-binding domain